MRKSCGGCKYFVKWKKDEHGGGLCGLLDARVKSDCCCNKFHKRIPYAENPKYEK